MDKNSQDESLSSKPYGGAAGHKTISAVTPSNPLSMPKSMKPPLFNNGYIKKGLETQ